MWVSHAWGEGLVLSPLGVPSVSPLAESLWARLAPDHISALPAAFSVASSLHLAVQSLVC